jgi:hypothetical protein
MARNAKALETSDARTRDNPDGPKRNELQMKASDK